MSMRGRWYFTPGEWSVWRVIYTLLAMIAAGALIFALTGCSDPVRDAQKKLEAEHILTAVSLEHAEGIKAADAAKEQHAKDLESISAKDQVVLEAEKISTSIHRALWIAFAALALNIAGAVFLGEFSATLAKKCAQLAMCCVALIGLLVVALFALPYLVHAISYVVAAGSVALILTGIGFLIYEIKTHPAVVAWLRDRLHPVFTGIPAAPAVTIGTTPFGPLISIDSSAHAADSRPAPVTNPAAMATPNS